MIQSWENFEFSRKELFDEIVGGISFIDAFNGAVLAQFAAESRTDFRVGALERLLFYALTINNCIFVVVICSGFFVGGQLSNLYIISEKNQNRASPMRLRSS